MTQTPVDLSIVVPFYNEGEGIELFYQRLTAVLDTMNLRCELIFVDDGSRDGTFEEIRRLAGQDERVVGVKLSRNFGHQMALCAGLAQTAGAYVATMDGDLQHPPELIPELWRQAHTGYDLTYTIRQAEEHIGWFKDTSSRMFYRLFRFLADVPLPPNAADFRIMSRQVCDAITELDERDLFLRGMLAWMGFQQTGIPYQAQKRATGQSKYQLKKMLNLSISAITSFSIIPLRLSLLLAAVSLCIAMLYSLYAVYVKLVLGHAVQGWTSLLILMSFLFSGLYIMLGIIGEYIARIHLETKKRPRYLIETVLRHSDSPS